MTQAETAATNSSSPLTTEILVAGTLYTDQIKQTHRNSAPCPTKSSSAHATRNARRKAVSPYRMSRAAGLGYMLA